MSMPARIILIGPMGAGKTAVGRALARRLRYDFADSDREVERKTGVDVSYVFDVEGEPGFRRREYGALKQLCLRDRIVIATGGGAITHEPSRRLLEKNGYCVYLKTSVEQQYRRTERSKTRPLLQTEDPKARLAELFDRRAPLYEALADHTADTDGKQVDAVARRLARHLKTQRGSSG